jgi:hypothetical protein
MALRKTQIAVAASVLLSVGMLSRAAPASARDDQTPGPAGQRRSWAARASSGVMLGGTWTVNEEQKPNAVAGTWTLLDAQGRRAASGGWSATKSAAGWTGRWRAAAAGRAGEYAGTWTARVDLKATASFADLFAKAIGAAVSGTFSAGAQSGAWTIQVFN